MTDDHNRSGKPGSAPPAADKRPSSRPPPSMAPPTDDIDAEWGASPEPAALKPAPLPAIEKAAAQPPLATLRKQTLLGLSPPAVAQSAPPAAAPSATATPLANLVKPASMPPASAAKPASVAPASVGAANKKQTLLGLAPPIVPTQSSPPPANPASASDAPVASASASTATASTGAGLPQVGSAHVAPAQGAAAAKAVQPGATTESDAPITADVQGSRAKPRTEAPPSSTGATNASKPPDRKRGSGAQLWLLFAAAAVAVGYFAARRNEPEPLPEAAAPAAVPVAVQSVMEPAPAPPEPVAVPAISAAADPTAAASVAPPSAGAAVPAAQATAAPPATAPVAPSAAPSAPAQAASAAAATGDAQQIHIVSDPPGARLFWKGKELGTTPYTLELPAGEKRALEIGMRGYITRKLIVDGTKTDIGVGMRPAPASAPPAAQPTADPGETGQN